MLLSSGIEVEFTNLKSMEFQIQTQSLWRFIKHMEREVMRRVEACWNGVK